tara:strand:- start:923 stop:1345 length:423 start_codon:yes stop_codon:yes gene_type:complete
VSTQKHVDKTLGLEFTIPLGEELAIPVGQDLKCPEGHAVIMLGYGDQPGLMYPQPVSAGLRTIWIPRGDRRAIPLSHLNVLLDAKTKKLIQPKPGAQGVEYEANRFDVQILKLPEAGAKGIKNKLEGIRERAERQQIHIN